MSVNNTVIYLINNTTYIGNNIKNSATCFGSVEPPSGHIQDTVLVHSASVYTIGSHIVYKLYNCIMLECKLTCHERGECKEMESVVQRKHD